MAGRKHSAAGTISHKRHDWKGHYGKGISRIPRKTMWRRGTQFYWIGAEISGTRGGRKAHAPELSSKTRKMNKKEMTFALNSAIASTISPSLISKRYASIEKEISPSIIESLPKKSKELFTAIKKIFADADSLVIKHKEQRAGRGKNRNRKYKSTRGLLIVTAENEKAKFSGVDIKSVKELRISDLYPLGRLTLYTHKAVEELGAKK